MAELGALIPLPANTLGFHVSYASFPSGIPPPSCVFSFRRHRPRRAPLSLAPADLHTGQAFFHRAGDFLRPPPLPSYDHSSIADLLQSFLRETRRHSAVLGSASMVPQRLRPISPLPRISPPGPLGIGLRKGDKFLCRILDTLRGRGRPLPSVLDSFFFDWPTARLFLPSRERFEKRCTRSPGRANSVFDAFFQVLFSEENASSTFSPAQDGAPAH